MFQINDDMSIYVTRGDAVAFSVAASQGDKDYTFAKGSIVRFKVVEKKNCETVVLQKDFEITSDSNQVNIRLEEEETRFGEVISKPTDYWYEVELNPNTNPQTILGYDEDGAKILKLFPEGKDLEWNPSEEDLGTIDEEFDLTSPRPVQNQVIARAINELADRVGATELNNLKIHATIREVVEEELDPVLTELIADVKTSEANAKEYMEKAFANTPEGYEALVDTVRDMEITTSKENTVLGTKNGGYRLTKVVANTKQKTTLGHQLFDASKLPTTSGGGATIKNNGDGSFTISGSGELTAPVSVKHDYTHEETLKLIKSGAINMMIEQVTMPYVYAYLRVDGDSDSNTMVKNEYKVDNLTKTILQEKLDDPSSYLRIGIYGGEGQTITGGTVKPMIYQNGNGTWEEFSDGNPMPSPSNQSPLLSTGDCVDMIQGSRRNSNAITIDNLWVASRSFIPCKNGDSISLIYDKNTTTLRISFYDSNKTYLAKAFVDNGKVVDGVAPTNASYFTYEVADVNGITPQTAGKITITINGKYLGVAKTRSKNLFDVSDFADSNYYSANRDSLIINKQDSRQYTAVKTFHLKPNTKYAISVQNPCSLYFGKDYDSAVRTDSPATYLNFTTSATGISHFKFLASSYPYEVGWVQLEEIKEYGEKTDYVPFGETVAYYLTQYPMIKGSTLFRENGLVKVEHENIQEVYDGSSAWGFAENNGTQCRRFYMAIQNPDIQIDTLLFCSNFTIGKMEEVKRNVDLAIYSQLRYICINDINSRWATTDDFNAYLSENPMTIVRKANEPIIETLDTASQIALNGLETFDGVTHVEFDTRVQPLEFEAEVGLTNETARLLKNELRNDTLEVKYNELAVAIVSQ